MSKRLRDRFDGPLAGAVGLVFLSGLATFGMVSPEPPALGPKVAIPRPTTEMMTLPYDLDTPDWTMPLPKALREVSGIAVTPTGTTAWAVNDEKGTLFQIDLVGGEVVETRRFARRGDYEGIESIGTMVVVARSDGQLWVVHPDSTDVHKSPLSKACDVEGLAHDPAGGRLLVACKGVSGPQSSKKQRLIYALDLPSFEWQATPAYVVKHSLLRAFIGSHTISGLKPKQAKDFSPSAIAVHPQTGHIYLISSRAKMLVVLDGGDGQVLSVGHLDRRVHRQPEGLAFDTKGSMYLSNEGRSKQAILHRFDPIRGPPPLPDRETTP